MKRIKTKNIFIAAFILITDSLIIAILVETFLASG